MGTTTTPLTGSNLPQSQLNKYIQEIQDQQVQHVVHHGSRWQTLHCTYWLPLLHKHTLSVFFSVSGMLSQGRRNCMSTSLETRVRLKLNANVLAWSPTLNLWLSASQLMLTFQLPVALCMPVSVLFLCLCAADCVRQLSIKNCNWNGVNTDTKTETKKFLKNSIGTTTEKNQILYRNLYWNDCAQTLYRN